jgi:spermidine/putrescine transport system ATP-binding protein
MTKHILRIAAVTKRFGDALAVDQVSLGIEEGELVTLLGPSGCGKTTLLRMIAGFEEPTLGTIEIAGQSMLGVPPHRRPVNMVFQRYALFPHLDVFENLAFGLRLKRMPGDEIKEKVVAMLDLVELPGFAHRRVTQLSGGEAQRVALARALIMGPKVLLLDEPLGALDLKIRKEMQVELKRIHVELGATFLYVTHDQEEAMTISDRIVIMNKGRIVQVGTPQEVYTDPNCTFCGSFVGEANILPGRVVALTSTGAEVDLGIARVQGRCCTDLQVGQEVNVLIRPEVLAVGDASDTRQYQNVLTGQVIDTVFLGSAVYYRIDAGAPVTLLAEAHVKEGMRLLRRHDNVSLGWAARDTLIMAG